MGKWIVAGDPHAQLLTPVSRTEKDFFKEVVLDKFSQIRKIADKHKAGIIDLGDFFSKARGGIELMHRGINEALRLKDGDVYDLPGNHTSNDTAGDLSDTSLDVMIALGLKTNCPIKNADWFPYHLREQFKTKSQDKNNKARIAFIHDYVVPYTNKTKYLVSEDLKECVYDIVFAGHYHIPYDVQVGKTRYINPGAMIRLTSDPADMNRSVQVVLFDDQTLEVEFIPLEVSPVNIAFDLTKKIETMQKEEMGAKFTEELNAVRAKLNNENDVWEIIEAKLAKTKIENEVEYNTIMKFLREV